VQPQYLDYLLEQLAGLGRVSTRRMFGGVGLYSGELFFGLIDDDTLFFKTDATNHAEYESRRMPRFMPPANRPISPMGYHQVPADIIEDAELLVAWARKAVGVALASHAARERKMTPKKTAKKAPKKAKPTRKRSPNIRTKRVQRPRPSR
jgi:DNA transformation protein